MIERGAVVLFRPSRERLVKDKKFFSSYAKKSYSWKPKNAKNRVLFLLG